MRLHKSGIEEHISTWRGHKWLINSQYHTEWGEDEHIALLGHSTTYVRKQVGDQNSNQHHYSHIDK